MTLYFESFPDILYNGENVKNIALRAKIMETYKSDATNFYPYVIKDGETADSIAYDYYQDPNLVWIVYYSNDIIDPYHDWFMSPLDFDAYIIKKYGSVTAALNKTISYKKIVESYYVNNTTNEYIKASQYNPAVNGYGWSRVDSADDIYISPDSPTLQGLNISEWEEIDAYTEETRINESKRNIKLLDRRLSQLMQSQLRSVLNGN